MKIFNIINQVQSSQMPDAAGSEKFYVTVAVIAIIFAGIVVYLISIDRKIKKLENKTRSDA